MVPVATAGAAVAQAGMDYFNTQASNINANEAAGKARSFAQREAQKQRDFQERLLDTSHQREKADLIKAGLNPILAANAGAGGAAGAMGSAPAAQTFKQDTKFDPMVGSQLKQAKAATANITADTGLKAANTKSAEKQAEVAELSKKLIMAQTAKEGEQARMSRIDADLADKYGDARSVMGLINSGTGSIGNLLGVGNLFKQYKDIMSPKTTTTESYSPRGEHTGTKTTRTHRD